jgi:drug/metabolite transporter (DMT)-like permease
MSRTIGVLSYTAAILFYGIGNVFFKYTIDEKHIDSYELAYWISLVMIIQFYINILRCKVDVLDLRKDYHLPIILRLVCGTLNDIFLYISFRYTTFAKATCIFYCSTFFVPFLAVIFLKEKLQKWDLLAMIIAFIGMLMIIRPFNDKKDYKIESINYDMLGCIFASISALFGAMCMISVRWLTTAGLHYSIIPFYYGLGCIMISPMFTLINPPSN